MKEARVKIIRCLGPVQASTVQRFLSSHAAIAKHFNIQRHLISRRTLETLRIPAAAEWREIVAA